MSSVLSLFRKRRSPERAGNDGVPTAGGRPAPGPGGRQRNAAGVAMIALAWVAAVGGVTPAHVRAQSPVRGPLAGSSFGPPAVIARPGNSAPSFHSTLPTRQPSLVRPGNAAVPVRAPLPTRLAPLAPAPAAGFVPGNAAVQAAPGTGAALPVAPAGRRTFSTRGGDDRRPSEPASFVVFYPFGTTLASNPEGLSPDGYGVDPGVAAPVEEHGFTLPAPNPDYTAAVVPSYQPAPPPSARGRSPQPRSEAVDPSGDDPAPESAPRPAPGLLVRTAAPDAGPASVPDEAPPDQPRRVRPAAAFRARPGALVVPAPVEDGTVALPADPAAPVVPPGEFVRAVQRSLRALSYYRGVVDGRCDEATSDALSRFQADHGLTPAGELDVATLRALRILPD